MEPDTRVVQLEAALDSIREDGQAAKMMLVGHPAQPMLDRIVSTAEAALSDPMAPITESSPEG